MRTRDNKPAEVYTGQLGPKHRAIVPKAVRTALRLEEGDTLMYVVEGERVRLTTRRQLAQDLFGSLAEDDGRDFTQELLDERRAEARREKP